MRLRSNRFAMLGLCLLPAVGLEVRTPHASFVASFFYACPERLFEPNVQTKPAADKVYKPRPESSPVGVFLRGNEPTRQYLIVGKVEILGLSRSTTVNNLILRASADARRLGGDALVDVAWGEFAGVRRESSEPAVLRLTANVARWD